METGALILGLGVPPALALLIALLGRWPNLRDSVMMAGTFLLFACVVRLTGPVWNGVSVPWTAVAMMPDLPIAFAVEPLGLLFALTASGLYILTGFYAIGYMRGHHEQNQTRFFACFALAIFAAIGAAFAANLLTLFVFYEFMTLITYPLVTHHGTDEARRAGRVYLGILLSSSVLFFLPGVIWTWILAGTLDFTPGGILDGCAPPARLAILLGLFAFGSAKAALMPLHRWLPAAMVAPTPVSALLHAVAVVKIGVFTILKIAVYIFGTDVLRDTGISVWLMYVAGFTILCASLVAMTRDNLKARLAYSTISQLSYIVLGAALANTYGVLGSGMHIAMHAFGKITLFFCAGAIYITAHKTRVSELDGLGRRMPWTFTAFAIAALGIIGLPPLGGCWSKWYLALGAAEAAQPLLVGVLMVSSLLNIAYLLPIPARAFFAKPPDEAPCGETRGLCLVPLCLTAVISVLLFFVADEVYYLLEPIAR